MNAEQIAEQLYEAADIGESPSYYHGFRMGALAMAEALRAANIDTEHTYEHPELGISEPWTAYAEWTDASGAERVKVIGAELFVRRPLG